MIDAYASFPDLITDRPIAHVVRITINRPDRMNAVNPALHDQLHRIWRVIDRDADARVAIITGAGKAFCAGGDIATIPIDAQSDPEAQFCHDFRAARELVSELINCCPTRGAIERS